MLKKLCVYIATTVLFTFHLQAQEAYQHVVYGTEDGLPSSDIHNVYQDSRDFLWVCTAAGLSRFDGRKFINYSAADGLYGALILLVKEDEKGNLWVATSDGLFKFEGKKFTKIDHKFAEITSLAFSNSKVWIGTKDGLYAYDNGKVISYKENGAQISRVSCLLLQTDGSLLIGTNEGIRRFINNTFTNFWKPETPVYVMNMIRDNDACIWFCTLEGDIFLYRDQHFTSVLMSDYPKNPINGFHQSDLSDKKEGFTGGMFLGKNNAVCFSQVTGISVFNEHRYSSRITGFMEPGQGHTIVNCIRDREDNIWIASLEGLIVLRKDYIKKYLLPFKGVWGIYNASDKNEIDISNGENIYKLSGDTALPLFKTPPGVLGALDMFSITPDSTYLFASRFSSIASYKHGKFHDERERIHGWFYSFLNYDNKTWIGCGNKICVYANDSFKTIENNNKEMPPVNAFCILPMGSDTFLLGSQYGLYKFHNGDYTHLAFPFKDQRVNIYDIHDCKDGTYLLASHGHGLMHVKPRDSTLEVLSALTTKNGLGTNYISKILVDNNTVWLTTRNGVYKINNYFSSPGIEYINTEDGMPHNTWTFSSIYMDKDSNILVGGSDGLVKFNKNTSFTSSIVSRTHIIKIAVNNADFNWGLPDTSISFTGTPLQYQFKYRQNSLEFYFTGINLYRPDRIKYEYQLEGFQDSSVSTKEDHATFNNLPPGDYLFKVRSTTNQAFSNEPYTSFRFVIRAPFWQTWWFRLLLLATIAGLIYAFYRWRLNQNIRAQRREIEVSRHLNESKILAFQARMNPHFIFNSLNAIQYFIINDDKLGTLNYLSKFAKLLRQILDNSIESKITLDKEVLMLSSYIEMEELRFDNHFSYTINIAPDLAMSNIEIPGMIIQPFIENAILHGLLHKTDKGLLKIDFETNGKQIICTVEDNGIGRKRSAELNAKKATNHRSHGTSIAINRLELLNNKEDGIINNVIFIDLEENAKALGTKVVIYIPIL